MSSFCDNILSSKYFKAKTVNREKLKEHFCMKKGPIKMFVNLIPGIVRRLLVVILMISSNLPEGRDVALDDDVVWNAIRLPDSNTVHTAGGAALLPAVCDPAEVQFAKQFFGEDTLLTYKNVEKWSSHFTAIRDSDKLYLVLVILF